MRRFDDKVAVVTGGSSGIGLATARLLASEGAQVYVTGRRSDALDQAVRSIGPGAVGVDGDAADLAHLERLFTSVAEAHGHLDVLFASAGAGNFDEPLGAISEESFDAVFGLNVRGTVFAVQKAVPLMTGGGSVVLNGAVGAVKGVPGTSVYSASKAALRSLVRVWAAEFKGTNVRVNIVNPGTIETSILANAPKAMIDGLVANIPLGRIGEPGDVAAAVAFLASEEASFITGSELFVDGGLGQI
jgi:NAD(P)-dependent dehydrogenase (short-subunit alcohol dehydrogenase family)